MEIYLANDYKTPNSTYQFPLDTTPSVEGELWDKTSVLAPVVRFNAGSRADHAPTQKLAYIPAFGKRYYFIKDWYYDQGAWNATMIVDPLATYKKQIGNSKQYISRAEFFSEGLIEIAQVPDSKYPIAGRPVVLQNSVNTGWKSGVGNTECYVVGIYGPGGTVGGITYYVMTPTQMRSFQRELYATADWLNPDAMGISEDLAKGLVNPAQYIESIRYYPYPPPFFTGGGSQLQTLQFSWWEIQATGFQVENLVYEDSWDITIPRWGGHQFFYQRLSPYSTFYLTSSAFGEIPIPADRISTMSSLHVQFSVDISTGAGMLTIPDIQMYRLIEFGVPIALAGRVSSKISSPTGMIASGISAAVDVANQGIGALVQNITGETFNPFEAINQHIVQPVKSFFGGAVNGVAAVSNSLAGNRETVTNVGTMGTQLNFVDTYLHLVGVFLQQTPAAPEIFGRPILKLDTVHNYPGYIEIIAPRFDQLDATTTEIQSICQYLESGFYYE